jgi:hypothetical protein
VPQRQLSCHFRLDVQDRARRLQKDPQAEQQEEVKKMRQFLSNQLGIIDALWQRSGALGGCLKPSTDVTDLAAFDHLDNDIAPDGMDVGNSGAVPDSTDPHNADQDAASRGYDDYFRCGANFDKGVTNHPEILTLPIPSNMDHPDEHHRGIEMRL